MTPQRRTALVSVGAACALIGLKLTTGLASGSLGLVSEAVHSGTDLVAALLTFFAVGRRRTARRPQRIRTGTARPSTWQRWRRPPCSCSVSIVVATFAVAEADGG